MRNCFASFLKIALLPFLAILVAASGLNMASVTASPIQDDDRYAIVDARVKALTKRLNLTAAQEAAAVPLLRTSVEKRLDVMDRYGLGLRSSIKDLSSRERRNLRAEMTKIQSDLDKDLAPLLTADQQAELLSIRKETRQQLRSRFRNN